MNKEQLLNELKTIFDGEPWYGNSIMKTIDEIGEENINNIFENSGSIAQIVAHILAWRNFTLEMLKGNFSYKIEINSTLDWDKKKIYNTAEWKQLISLLKQNQIALITIIESKSDSFLTKQITKKKYSYLMLIKSSIQHDLYHLGQIALLNK